MRSLRRHTYARLIIAGLYGLAMLLMPMAHRPVRQATSDLTAYALPDGSAPLLCSSLSGQSRGPNGRSIAICDACLLTAAPGLVIAGLMLAPPPATPPMRIGFATEPIVVGQKDLTDARPRAPPANLA